MVSFLAQKSSHVGLTAEAEWSGWVFFLRSRGPRTQPIASLQTRYGYSRSETADSVQSNSRERKPCGLHTWNDSEKAGSCASGSERKTGKKGRKKKNNDSKQKQLLHCRGTSGQTPGGAACLREMEHLSGHLSLRCGVWLGAALLERSSKIAFYLRWISVVNADRNCRRKKTFRFACERRVMIPAKKKKKRFVAQLALLSRCSPWKTQHKDTGLISHGGKLGKDRR